MRKIAIILTVLALGGCENTDMNRGGLIGAAVGAAAGGALGYQFGGGLGQILYTAGGALAGGASGYVVGQRLSAADQAAYNRTAIETLAHAADGQLASWSNQETERSGIFRATRSFYASDGHLCRDYRATVSFEDSFGTAAGTSCRGTDGRWTPVVDQFG